MSYKPISQGSDMSHLRKHTEVVFMNCNEAVLIENFKDNQNRLWFRIIKGIYTRKQALARGIEFIPKTTNNYIIKMKQSLIKQQGLGNE